MKEIDFLLENYLAESITVVRGKKQRRKVVGGSPADVDVVIESDLPALLEKALKSQGRNASEYKIYGSVGQPNRYVAKIPWVGVLYRDITTSTTHGYYIVILFKEDMNGFALSLNQGFTQFQRAFGTDDLVHRKVREAAANAATYLAIPTGFVLGKIDLAATGDMGAGYEDGAIISKLYDRTSKLSESELMNDLDALLKSYDALRDKCGPDLISLAPPATDSEFQDAATELSTKPVPKESAFPPGPIKPTARTGRGASSGFRRDPKISGEALRNAAHMCEIDPGHQSFTSRITGKRFVEAHHLLPMQYQDQFSARLDVPENIIVLCPTCHRRLHHGLRAENKADLKMLLERRAMLLKERGLEIDNNGLLKFYNCEIKDF